MKLSKLYLAVVAGSAMMLAGCGDSAPTQGEELAYLDQAAGTQLRQQVSTQSQELKQAVAELQKQDPAVKDAYYGINEQGEKVMHVVREEANGTVSDSVWPLIGGMATGYLMAQMINSNGGYSNYSRYHSPVGHSYYANTDEERRKRRNIVTSGYSSYYMSHYRSSIKSSPTYRSNMTKAVISTRSPGVFSSSSSARSSGYSSGS